jgi:hypothetical protein
MGNENSDMAKLRGFQNLGERIKRKEEYQRQLMERKRKEYEIKEIQKERMRRFKENQKQQMELLKEENKLREEIRKENYRIFKERMKEHMKQRRDRIQSAFQNNRRNHYNELGNLFFIDNDFNDNNNDNDNNINYINDDNYFYNNNIFNDYDDFLPDEDNNNIINNYEEEPSNEIVKKLEEIEITNGIIEKAETKECPICLMEYSANNKICYLPCFHFFHSKCIKNWCKQSKKCPLCNINIDFGQ